jgi:hypothetical protein
LSSVAISLPDSLLCLRNIRRHNERLWQQRRLHCRYRVIARETIAAFASMTGSTTTNGMSKSAIALATVSTMDRGWKHAGLRGVGADVGHHCFDLLTDEVWLRSRGTMKLRACSAL